ncbi:MAG: glucoamylase [Actinomycetia bacterium]|nr:glucoamylase [Actinomycetes bacterium]
MSRPIEDYALIGDLQSAALVSRDGSIDWLCLPQFDSEACFAALLADERYGYWRIAPAREFTRVRRRYRPGTLVLETEFSTPSGVVRLVDCMPPRDADPVLIRLVEGVAGRVDMRMTLAARFEYGLTLPRIRPQDTARRIMAGGQSLWVFSPLQIRTVDADLVARFSVGEGDRVPVAAVWRPSHLPAPAPPPASALVEQTDAWWRRWVAGLRRVDEGAGEGHDAVIRSLITLKALSYAPTGGLLAAPTTSLPQQACGMRNWDYRYCWIRDAADAVDVFLAAGADQEAASLLDWLGQAVGGPAAQVQQVYRITGERRMPEIEAHWLPGYENAQPVRIGNAAAGLPQLGTFGDVLRARLAVRAAGLPMPGGTPPGRTQSRGTLPGGAPPGAADLDESEAILSFLEARWQEPDAGIWAVRGPPRQFVHTKAMIWAAADSAITMIESFGDRGPARRWRRLRAAVHADVLDRGYDPDRNTFTQHYGSAAVDASLLHLPLLGFLSAADPRIAGTVAAISRELDDSGVLLRYQARPAADADGLPPGEAGYLPGSFWLAQALAAAGRTEQARQVYAALLGLRNDVGLLAEGYDPLRRRLAGNYPLASSHIGLIMTARALTENGQFARSG